MILLYFCFYIIKIIFICFHSILTYINIIFEIENSLKIFIVCFKSVYNDFYSLEILFKVKYAQNSLIFLNMII